MISEILHKDILAAVIVLYNPDDSTVGNIASYIDHVSHLYVIDNTEKPSEDLTKAILQLSTNITYYPLGGNLGIATALNKGSELAYNNGYKWALTMDQDSCFENGDFFSGVFGKAYNDVAIIAASYNAIHFMPRKSPYTDLTEVSFVITSGNILNLDAWKLLGGFCDKMFIDEVDNEFCIRAANSGFKILTTNRIYLRHKLGESFKVKHFITGRELVLTRHSPVRVYYTTRNNLFIWRRLLFSNTRFVANRIRNVLTLIFKVAVYFPDKKTYFKYIRKAIVHSLKGRYGKFAG